MAISAQFQNRVAQATAWLRRFPTLTSAGLVLALFAAITAYNVADRRSEAQAEAWVAHTSVVMHTALDLENKAMLMEADQRGFLLSNDPAYLVSRERHRQQAIRVLADLRGLTRGDASQQARLEAVAAQLEKRVARMRYITDVAQREGIEAARAQFMANGIEPLRAAIEDLNAEEARMLAVRSRAAEAEDNRSKWAMLVIPGFVVVLLGVGLFFLLFQLRYSENLRAELKRSNKEALHALGLLDATHDGVFVYDAGTLRISYANQGASNQIGYSRAELLGMSALAFKPGFDEAGFRRLLAPLLEGKVDAVTYETVHRCKHGQDVPVEVVSRVAREDDGASSVVTVSRDLGARKQAEAERDSIFDLSMDLICIASADGYFKQVNPAFTWTLGWSREELLHRPFLDFVHPDDRAATLAEVDRLVVAGEPVMRFENRYRHKDGTWRMLSWKAQPQAGGLMFGSARDVTEQRAAEQRIVNLNHELTGRQARLEAANKDLEAFSYSVSHDLRAPLRHVVGYAQMLAEDMQGRMPAEAQAHLRTIVESANRMGRLIDDLLAFSRLGRKPLARQPVDMRALAQRAVDEVTAASGGRIGAQVSIADAIPAAHGDPALLQQVWINLVSNAAKYSAPRGEAARIEVGGRLEGDHALYWVRDNGVGFDMRYADKLFGVFQRLHAQDQFEGTGVGLAIAHRIVARHGGQIHATGELDRGACFSFELPISEVANEHV